MRSRTPLTAAVGLALVAASLGGLVCAQEGAIQAGPEMTTESRLALDRGLEWLATHQGPQGNWGSDDLGLVSLGVLAFLADGHFTGREPYGETVDRALDYILRSARPDGLLNIAHRQRDMYNHGLSTFVLGQAYGMTDDPRLGMVLERALQLIAQTQCADGGWDYRAQRMPQGHDLSLAVMQANALRSAVDSGFEVSPQVIRLAIGSVAEHYVPTGVPYNTLEPIQRLHNGQFAYMKHGRGPRTLAMAAAGVVCLQEFGQYGDWRIEKNLDVIAKGIEDRLRKDPNDLLDPYTLYYVGQAVYQVGDPWWTRLYPQLREMLVRTQVIRAGDPQKHGMWPVTGNHVTGQPGQLFATAVGCFVLAIPNRYLPILQEGRIEGFEGKF